MKSFDYSISSLDNASSYFDHDGSEKRKITNTNSLQDLAYYQLLGRYQDLSNTLENIFEKIFLLIIWKFSLKENFPNERFQVCADCMSGKWSFI